MSVKQVLKEVLFGEKPPTTSATTTTAPLAQPLSQPALVQTPLVQTQTLSASTVNPPQVDVEVVRRAPVVREVIHPLEKHEVNPVIYREREQTEVRQVEQPIYEKVQKPVVIREAALPSETRPVQQLQTGDFDLKYQELNQQYQPSVSYAPVERETVTRPPVVIETIRKHVKEEIQPVIYREILQQEIVRETKPIHERIIEAPTLIKLQASPLYETRNLQESLPSVVAPVGGTTGVGLTGTPLGGVSYGGDLSSSSSNIPISGPSTYGVGFNQMGTTTTNLPMSYGTTSNIPISGTSYGTTSNLPMSGASYGTTSNIPISSGSMGTSAIPSTNIPISGPSSVVGSAIRDVKNVVNEGLQRSGSSSHWNTSTS